MVQRQKLKTNRKTFGLFDACEYPNELCNDIKYVYVKIVATKLRMLRILRRNFFLFMNNFLIYVCAK